MAEQVRLRTASGAELEAVADLLAFARSRAFPLIPKAVHPHDTFAPFLQSRVAAGAVITVAELGGQMVGVMVTEGPHLEQLAIHPDFQRRGIGAQLVAVAKSHAPGRLALWTFVSNTAAQAFYESQGFTVIGGTDGDNEEGEPDLEYGWFG